MVVGREPLAILLHRQASHMALSLRRRLGPASLVRSATEAIVLRARCLPERQVDRDGLSAQLFYSTFNLKAHVIFLLLLNSSHQCSTCLGGDMSLVGAPEAADGGEQATEVERLDKVVVLAQVQVMNALLQVAHVLLLIAITQFQPSPAGRIRYVRIIALPPLYHAI